MFQHIFVRLRRRRRSRSRAEYLKYRDIARSLVLARLEHYNKIYNFKWGRVSIRNQKTRWGSCSNKGNLNFNYKIALLPERLASYIIVHELCHLGEFNHSYKFWDLVSRAIPDHLTLRAELKKIGISLN